MVYAIEVKDQSLSLQNVDKDRHIQVIWMSVSVHCGCAGCTAPPQSLGTC